VLWVWIKFNREAHARYTITAPVIVVRTVGGLPIGNLSLYSEILVYE
jgi:hypothetical protein